MINIHYVDDAACYPEKFVYDTIMGIDYLGFVPIHIQALFYVKCNGSN